jgi:hypothetical protein
MVDIADYTKKMAQIGINYAFPRTGTIAAISAGVGWYTYQWGLTFGPQLAANAVIRQWEEWVPFAGWYIGKGLSPFIIPQATPYIASQISLGCSLATTLTLKLKNSLITSIYCPKFWLKQALILLRQLRNCKRLKSSWKKKASLR